MMAATASLVAPAVLLFLLVLPSGAEAVTRDGGDSRPGAGDRRWAEVRAIMEDWPTNGSCIDGTCWMQNFVVTVGNSSGRVFQHQVGSLVTLDTPLLTASASKFPSALAILGTVIDGYVELDEPVSTYLKFWTTDQSDPRSRVTLRTLLSFTSGFYDAGVGGDVPCMGIPFYDFVKCAEMIYEKAAFAFEPGTVFDYNSFHLQLAGAVACAATGKSIGDVLRENLFERWGLTHTHYLDITNPELAAGLIITGNDYEKILRQYLTYEKVSKSLAADIETDYTDPENGVEASNSTIDLAKSIGHYGFAHWIECWNNGNDTLTPKCKRDRLHSDPGLFGYYPLVDRRNDYYMQIVMMHVVTNTSNFGPTEASSGLRLKIKPIIDEIMSH